MLPVSEAMQMQAAPRKRAQRQTLSCHECRRRKQKCSQGQPCTNCYRRFPQPDCVYEVKSSKRNIPVAPRLPLPSVADVREGPYSHLNPATIHDTLSCLDDEPSGSSSEADSSVITSSSRPRTNIWKPFNVASTENAIKTITTHGIKAAKLSFSEEPVVNQDITSGESYRLVASPIGNSTAHLHYLPMRLTKLNKELVRIHLQLLSRFKCAVDGDPDPRNDFMNTWVPATVQDPLLLQIVLFTSSCFLSETGHMSKSLQNVHKWRVISMLNSQLKDENATMTDPLILGVVQMIADSWYWGDTHDLKCHLGGLRAMILKSGSLNKLGMRGYLAKMILINDIGMALAHEIRPSIYGRHGFAFHDSRAMPFKTAFNTPLICNWQSFRECSNSLQLHPSTAQILDDMRRVLADVLALPKTPTVEEVKKVTNTANCVYTNISDLPEDKPPLRTPFSNSSRSSSAESPESTTTETQDLPDIVYVVIRRVALMYCRAILTRSPISSTCSEQDITEIWYAIWRSGLPTWKSVLGIFVWIMIALVSNCHKIGPGRLIKTLTISTMMSIGMEDWQTFTLIVKTSFRLQRYLAGGDHGRTNDLIGGEKVVDKYGFAMKDVLPTIELPIDGEL
ncbi:hypothetical protein KAF25_009729 [Fusarium avenaceum]|uniref:Zn(2)-C6 fungal-type domain-containing protein n=1 Tax=Fusarium avenaceum TaxID=40199 RepID=A0A9P7HBK9_9HYPO|nr:hypothetical protein KAF25_009729 [Fusarium avenaceum]